MGTRISTSPKALQHVWRLVLNSLEQARYWDVEAIRNLDNDVQGRIAFTALYVGQECAVRGNHV